MRRGMIAMLAGMLVFAFSTNVALANGGENNNNNEGGQLEGVIESLPPGPGLVGDWVVSGVKVHVTASTEIDQEGGPVAVGASVDVEGTAEADGSITADQISVQETSDDDEFGDIQFEGTIQALPASGLVGDWTVSGIKVHVTTATELGGSFAVGTAVQVEGLLEVDGSVTASQIEAQDQNDDDNEISATLDGVLQHLPNTPGHVGTWTVSTQTVRVMKGTRIVTHGHQLTKGTHLKVKGAWRHSGTIRATKVVVRG